MKKNERTGFTLVELLIAIAIIGILSSMVLFTVAGAQRDAKRSKTRATIEKLNSIIMERFEEYRYRSVKLALPISMTRKDPNTGIVALRPREAARIRAIVLKDIMRMEMPDRKSDLAYPPANVTFQIQTSSGTATRTLDAAGGRYSSREYNILRVAFGFGSLADPYTGTVAASTSAAWTDDWQSAECLYAIVAHSTLGGAPALEGFHASEIGDKDGDGYLEFWDAWETPIEWVRWPVAFPSELNLSYKGTDPANPAAPDAFDPYRAHDNWLPSGRAQKAWTLVPLILSAGPDGVFGVNNSAIQAYALSLDPYTESFGTVSNAVAASDNLSNHDILLEQ